MMLLREPVNTIRSRYSNEKQHRLITLQTIYHVILTWQPLSEVWTNALKGIFREE